MNPARRFYEIMNENVTQRQADVFNFIVAHLIAEQCTPTIREIGKHFGIGSPNGVVCHLKSLEDKGHIKRIPGESRNIRLIGVKLTIERTEAA